MTAEQMNRVKAHAYARGWEDGAAGLWDRACTLTDLAVTEYADGYAEGKKLRRNMRAAVASSYGADPEMVEAEEALIDQQQERLD